MKDLPILISFSGGRTSAFMTKYLMEHPRYAHLPKHVVFANTGKEEPATLDFVHECDTRWNLGVVWVEALVRPDKGIGTTFRQVDYHTASRNGEPFEAVIAKYGIPSLQAPHCTRELKQKPMKAYMQSLGHEDWQTAIGIRADEAHRRKEHGDGNTLNPFYPLADDMKAYKQFIRWWWEQQPFDLKLKDYQGNCDLCYKKSKRKRLTIIREDPRKTEWWQQMEEKYGKGLYQFDQREGLTIAQLVERANYSFSPVLDEHEASKMQTTPFEPEWDLEWDCMCKAS